MDSTLKRTWAEIDLDALEYNLAAIGRHVGPGVKRMGVVKADAYGHGGVQVARHLEKCGAEYLAVATLDEAAQLRESGVSLPILVLGHTPTDQARRILAYGVTQTVQDLDTARSFSALAQEQGQKMAVHVKLDTGMGRLGFQCDQAHFQRSAGEILELLRLPGLAVEGVYTHFAVSDEKRQEHVDFTRLQHDRFRAMVERVEGESGYVFPLHHCCNAGGIANHPEWAWDMVRCGIILYGAGELARKMGLRPVMKLKTVVSVIREMEGETSVGYGRRFFTEGPSRIAVLPIGYADGLFRSLGNRLLVQTPYGKAPVVGRVCMDMCMLDVTQLPELAPGDEVEIYGPENPCEQAAQLCGTIPYELLCAVSKRVPRHYYLGGTRVE